MNKIIKYINETETHDIVQSVISNKKDPWSVIEQVKASRVEYQKKSQQLQDELAKHLPAYAKGMILEVKEDCMNNFTKGQQVEVTAVSGAGCVVDDVVALDEKWLRQYFTIAESK